MNRVINRVINLYKKINIETILGIFFQIMILSSFWGPTLLAVTVPGIGEIFLFRVALLVVCCIYIYFLIKKRIHPLKERTKIEYAAFGILGVMLLYGFISLARAIDFGFTFRRLFNLSFDALYLLLIILYVDNKRKINITMINIIINVLLLQLLGVYETFFGGVFYDMYDDFLRVPFFNRLLQPPVVSFGNTNDYITSILFYLPFIIMFLIFHISNSKSRKLTSIYTLILITSITLEYYLANSARAQLGQLAWYIIVFGFLIFVLIYLRKLYKMLIMIFILFAFVSFTENFLVIRAKTINTINTIKYERELKLAEQKIKVGDNEVGDKESEEKEVIDSIAKPGLVTVPKSNELSIKDQFIAKDEETGETILNMNASGGGRLTLLKFAGSTFIKSYGMGVGLGNTEQKAKVVANEQLGGLWSLHCFPARIIADMGIFILIPVLIAIIILLKEISRMAKVKKDSKSMNMVLFFVIVSILVFPILSTISSDAQDMISMWFSLGGIIIIVSKYQVFIETLKEQSSSENT